MLKIRISLSDQESVMNNRGPRRGNRGRPHQQDRGRGHGRQLWRPRQSEDPRRDQDGMTTQRHQGEHDQASPSLGNWGQHFDSFEKSPNRAGSSRFNDDFNLLQRIPSQEKLPSLAEAAAQAKSSGRRRQKGIDNAWGDNIPVVKHEAVDFQTPHRQQLPGTLSKAPDEALITSSLCHNSFASGVLSEQFAKGQGDVILEAANVVPFDFSEGCSRGVRQSADVSGNQKISHLAPEDQSRPMPEQQQHPVATARSIERSGILMEESRRAGGAGIDAGLADCLSQTAIAPGSYSANTSWNVSTDQQQHPFAMRVQGNAVGSQYHPQGRALNYVGQNQVAQAGRPILGHCARRESYDDGFVRYGDLMQRESADSSLYGEYNTNTLDHNIYRGPMVPGGYDQEVLAHLPVNTDAMSSCDPSPLQPFAARAQHVHRKQNPESRQHRDAASTGSHTKHTHGEQSPAWQRLPTDEWALDWAGEHKAHLIRPHKRTENMNVKLSQPQDDVCKLVREFGWADSQNANTTSRSANNTGINERHYFADAVPESMPFSNRMMDNRSQNRARFQADLANDDKINVKYFDTTTAVSKLPPSMPYVDVTVPPPPLPPHSLVHVDTKASQVKLMQECKTALDQISDQLPSHVHNVNMREVRPTAPGQPVSILKRTSNDMHAVEANTVDG